MNQCIYISPRKIEAVEWNNGDIDSIEVFSMDSPRADSTLYQRFEEFIYSYPQLLKPDRNTTVILNLTDAYMIPLGLTGKQVDALWNCAFPDKKEDGEILCECDYSRKSRIVTALPGKIMRLMQRSFHPLKIKSIFEIYLRSNEDNTDDNDTYNFVNTGDGLICFAQLNNHDRKDLALMLAEDCKNQEHALFFFSKIKETFSVGRKVEIIWEGDVKPFEDIYKFLEKTSVLQIVEPVVPKDSFRVYVRDLKSVPTILKQVIFRDCQ